MISLVKKMILWAVAFSLMPFGQDSITDSKLYAHSAVNARKLLAAAPLPAQSVEIDEQGNIILKEDPKPTPKPVPSSPTPAEPTKPATESPLPATPPPPPAPVNREEILIDNSSPTPTQAPPKDFGGPNRASVRSRVTQVRSLPKEDSQAVVLLRRGDRVDVLQYQGDYYRIRYLIDGDFPVEGWVLQESIQLDEAGQKPIEKMESNRYRPTEREEVLATSPALPSNDLPENVKLPEDKATITSPEEVKKEKRVKEKPAMVFSKDEKPLAKSDSPWKWTAGVRLGYSQYHDAISTQNTAGTTNQFLEYTLEGFSIEALGGFSYPLHSFLVGARAHYNFTLYDSEVSDLAGGVSKSSVLAQLHDFGVAGFASRRFDFKKFSLEPELEFGANYQYLSLNSLRDLTLNQTVLFGHGMIYMTVAATPRAYLPYDLILEPELKLTLFQSFTEYPTALLVKKTSTTPAEYMRTGQPKTGSMLLSYGGSLAYSLAKMGYENSRLRAFGYISDFSKKFSSTGNRAGIRTENAKTKTDIIRAGLGYEYQF